MVVIGVVMVVFPLLEAAFGLCVGCRLFSVLMRLGLVPEEVCLDCADVCDASASLGLRRTGSNEAVLKELLEFCARVCDACAAECESHDHEHCKLCAQMCRECAEDCHKAVASLA